MMSTLSCTVGAAERVDTAECDPAQFRHVLGHFASGVVIVTATTPTGPVGLTCQSFSALSLAPPMVLFCVRRESWSWQQIRWAESFCVNILRRGQEELCERFAMPSVDRFDGVGLRRTAPGGPPVLADVLGWVECAIEDVHPGGDHDIVVGRVGALGVSRAADPLLYFRGSYGRFVSPCASRQT